MTTLPRTRTEADAAYGVMVRNQLQVARLYAKARWVNLEVEAAICVEEWAADCAENLARVADSDTAHATTRHTPDQAAIVWARFLAIYRRNGGDLAELQTWLRDG